MIQANCRTQFTAEDFTFVVESLAKSSRESASLLQLLSDPTERDAILDLEVVYREMIDHRGCLRVSPPFYFYMVTRRVMLRAGIDDRNLCDYVAAMLTTFAQTRQLATPGADAAAAGSRQFVYVCDMLKALSDASPEQVFLLRSHLGNYALFLTGIFADRVQAHAERRGAPGLSFYESVGTANYRTAAQHPQARRCELHNLYEQLAAEFRSIRRALNQLAETIIHCGDHHHSPLKTWTA